MTYELTEIKKDTMNRCAWCQRIPCNYKGDYFTEGVESYLCSECREIYISNRPINHDIKSKESKENTDTVQDTVKPKTQPIRKPVNTLNRVKNSVQKKINKKPVSGRKTG